MDFSELRFSFNALKIISVWLFNNITLSRLYSYVLSWVDERKVNLWLWILYNPAHNWEDYVYHSNICYTKQKKKGVESVIKNALKRFESDMSFLDYILFMHIKDNKLILIFKSLVTIINLRSDLLL